MYLYLRERLGPHLLDDAIHQELRQAALELEVAEGARHRQDAQHAPVVHPPARVRDSTHLTQRNLVLAIPG